MGKICYNSTNNYEIKIYLSANFNKIFYSNFSTNYKLK